jgi:hypothetical protein
MSWQDTFIIIGEAMPANAGIVRVGPSLAQGKPINLLDNSPKPKLRALARRLQLKYNLRKPERRRYAASAITANVSAAVNIAIYEEGSITGKTNQTIGCVIVLAPNATDILFNREKFNSRRA